MINKWWFRLYTKDYLIGLLKVSAFCVVVDLGMTQFAGTFKFFSLFVVALPMISLFIKNSTGTLRSNIEFHKMSIPFPELKSALLLEMFISVSATFASCLIVFICSLYLGGIYSTKIGQACLNIISPGMGLYFFILAFFSSLYILIINKDRKYLMIDFSTSRVKNFLNTLGITFFAVLFMISLAFIIPSTSYIGLIAPASIFAGAFLFHQKAIFHQYREKGRLRDFAKFWSAGTAVCLSFYFLCVLISRNDVLNEKLHPIQRASSYEFNSLYNPEIDVETFQTIERYVSYDAKKTLYSDLSFNASTLGLDYFLDDKDQYSTRLVALLKYSKPSPEFLIVLYDHFEKKPDYWKEKKNLPMILDGAFVKWPKSQKLPDRFIVAKQSSHELFKKDSAERLARAKARRELASQEEE